MPDKYGERLAQLQKKRKQFADAGNDAKVKVVDGKIEQTKQAQAKAAAKASAAPKAKPAGRKRGAKA